PAHRSTWISLHTVSPSKGTEAHQPKCAKGISLELAHRSTWISLHTVSLLKLRAGYDRYSVESFQSINRDCRNRLPFLPFCVLMSWLADQSDSDSEIRLIKR